MNERPTSEVTARYRHAYRSWQSAMFASNRAAQAWLSSGKTAATKTVLDQAFEAERRAFELVGPYIAAGWFIDPSEGCGQPICTP